MKKSRRKQAVRTFGLVVCTLAAAVSLATAQQRPTSQVRLKDLKLPGLNEKVFLDTLEAMDVVQVIEYLALKGGLNNIVIGKGVSGQATKLKLKDVPVADAFEVVLSMNGLAYEVKGDIITVMADSEYKAIYGTSFNEQKRVEMIDLKYADPARVATLLGSVKSSIGTVVSDPIAKALVLIDTPDKIAEMQAVIQRMDTPTETRTFALQYAEPEDIQAQIAPLVSKESGSIMVNKRTKTLVVRDYPSNLDKVNELITTFDRRQKQVFIEAKIVEVTLSDAFSLGINWQQVFQSLDPRYSFSVISKQGLIDSRPSRLTRERDDEKLAGTMLSYNTIAAGGDLQAVLQALKQMGETRMLQNPQIAVKDGEKASIQVVEDQPYKEVTLESGTTNVTGVTYLFKKVGVQLDVTPRINDEEIISVAIKPEISSISEWYNGGPQEGTPVVKKSTAETMVMVKNGVTIIIGGMIRNEKTSNVVKVPGLGSIPLLGRLFKYTSEASANKETVVFMTPKIITGEQSFVRAADAKRDLKPLRSGGADEKPMKPVR